MAIDWSVVAPAWEGNADTVEQAKQPATTVLLERLAIGPGDRVLELGAGPGSLGRRLAALTGPEGSVLLTDVAPGMVEIARRRNAGVAPVEVDVVDATATGLPGSTFDVVLFRMGLMLVEQPATALAEIRRVLVPGGRAGVMVWAGPEHNPWLTTVGMAAMAHGVVAGGPPTGPGGVFSLGDPATLGDLLGAAGLTDVTVAAIETPFSFATPEDHFAMVSVMAPPLAAALGAADPDTLAKVRATAADLTTPHASPTGLVLPGRALVATGRAPRSGVG